MKLTYFNLYARAEPLRMMLCDAKIDFEDERLEFSEWPEIKPTTPAG